MDPESKLSEIIQLILGAHQNNKTTLELHNSLFSRINTFVYISQDPNFSKLADTTKILIDDVLTELKDILQEISGEDDGIFQKARQLFSQSSTKRVEAIIPKLLKVSDQTIQSLTVQKYIAHQVNQKRKVEELKISDEVEIIEASAMVKKKVKNKEETMATEARIHSETNFTINFICHPKLEGSLPIQLRHRTSEWSPQGSEDVFFIKRDDFLMLPKEMVVKISKDHAKIRGWKETAEEEEETKEGEEKKRIAYEILDTSVNGTYYLGNRIDGMSKQKPMKLKREVPFQLRHGDCVGILMDKEAKTNEMMIGFEFSAEDKKIEEEIDLT